LITVGVLLTSSALVAGIAAGALPGEDGPSVNRSCDVREVDWSNTSEPVLRRDPGAPGVIYFDYLDEDGRLSSGRTVATAPVQPSSPVHVGVTRDSVTPLFINGPSANRIDVVFLGDGYTATELGSYADHVNAIAEFLFEIEPFASYQSAFNFYRIDVVSNESGVDHDPTFGTSRDTALDAGLWCDGIERLLCVDTVKSSAYAAAAVDADWIVVVANSAQYGGTGYADAGIIAVSGRNHHAAEIFVHEMGHAVADLGDEYDFADGAAYSGPELPNPNVSILDAAQMAASGTKWAPWLGTDDSSCSGEVSAYEGAEYKQIGVYRPTADSMMRNITTHHFNPPSIEALLLKLYEAISPVDGSSPINVTYSGSDQIFVEPLAGIESISIQWFLGDDPIPGATSPVLDLSTIVSPSGGYVVSVEVVDTTSFVRDEAARDRLMTGELQFTVDGSSAQ
jgi:hypothetical protein